MSTDPKAPAPRARRGSILLECIVVTLAGLLFGLLANQLSRRGLALSENPFLPLTNAPVMNTNPTNGTLVVTNPPSILDILIANALQAADSNLVYAFFLDPRYAQDLIIFIDAREDKYYHEGHIPGAHQLDNYRKDNYLPKVLPACSNAQQIVIYCYGGHCDDSLRTANTLRQEGVANDKLFVYPGGMSEWIANGWPVEVGQRKSGQLRAAPAATNTASSPK